MTTDPACIIHEIANRVESLEADLTDETRAALARLNGAAARAFRTKVEKNYVTDEDGDPA